MRGVPWGAAPATSPRESASYFRKTGGEKRNRFGRVFEFKSTVFDRLETTTGTRYAPQKLDSRVALLDARPPLPPRPHAHAALFSAACGLQWRARRIAEGLGRTFRPVSGLQLRKRISVIWKRRDAAKSTASDSGMV